MKTLSTAAVVALMTASLGLGAAAPTLAQQAPAAEEAQPGTGTPAQDRGLRAGGQGMRHGGGADLLGLERGAEAIEIAIVRISHAIELTDEQKALLDTLKTDALAAAAGFESATEGLRPATPGTGNPEDRPDISTRFNNRIAMSEARLAAMQAVQPAFTAFFDSLSDEQKAALVPEQHERQAGAGNHMGQKGDGQRQGGMRPMGPGSHR